MNSKNYSFKNYLRKHFGEVVMDFIGPLIITMIIASIASATIEVYIGAALMSLVWSAIRVIFNYRRNR